MRTIKWRRSIRTVIPVLIGCSLATNAFANDPPVARPDGPYSTHSNPLHGVLLLNQILANDTDDGGVVNLSGPIEDPNNPLNDHATVTKHNSTTIRYQPNGGYAGTDTFRYRINDGQNFHSAIVTVNVTANRQPIADAETVSTDEGQAVTIAVLVGDTDPDGDPVALSGPINDPVHPLNDHATVIRSGSMIIYTPNPGFVGTDTFRYRINDGHLFDSAVVTVTVNDPSPPPPPPPPPPPVPVCDGPGDLEQALADALRDDPVSCQWISAYRANFPNSMGGGSFNSHVLAAAIAAIESPNLSGPDEQHPGVRGWWKKYLRGELGQRGTEWAFGGKEPFSHVYQHYNLGAVMAVNYEARRRGWTDVRGLARQWLRASFSLMALAAVDEPKTFHDRTTTTTVSNNYTGPWVATAGMRSWWSSWGWMSRNILFARAVGLATNARTEANYQTDLRTFLEGADNSWNQSAEGDVYGLTPTEKSGLAGIKTSGQLPANFATWIAGVRTVVPYHFVAWPGVRVTLMEASRNNNTAPTYGIAYFQAARDAGGKEAHFLYPWNRAGRAHRNCIRHGSASINTQLTQIEATNGPAPTGGLCVGKHPEVTVPGSGSPARNLPGGVPQYHLVIPPYRTNW